MNDTIIYVYVVLVDDGFYMESDVSVACVFLKYKNALKYTKVIEHEHNYVYIKKMRLHN